jgi:hypothetical protein
MYFFFLGVFVHKSFLRYSTILELSYFFQGLKDSLQVIEPILVKILWENPPTAALKARQEIDVKMPT